MTPEEFASELEASLDAVEPGTLRPETRLDSIEGWDSLAVLTAIALVDEAFGASVTGEEVRGCETVGDLHALGVRKGG